MFSIDVSGEAFQVMSFLVFVSQFNNSMFLTLLVHVKSVWKIYFSA